MLLQAFGLPVMAVAMCAVLNSGTLSVSRVSGALRPWMLGAQGWLMLWLIPGLNVRRCAAGSFGDQPAAM